MDNFKPIKVIIIYNSYSYDMIINLLFLKNLNRIQGGNTLSHYGLPNMSLGIVIRIGR